MVNPPSLYRTPSGVRGLMGIGGKVHSAVLGGVCDER